MEQQSYKRVENYLITNEVLGKGQYGEVKKAIQIDDHRKIYAVKIVDIRNMQVGEQKKLQNEIKILKKIKSHYIVKFYDFHRTKNNLYMFFELCDEGDLEVLLKRREGKLIENEAVKYFRQICAGFKVLYENKMIHRDIKPANILVKDGRALIADFGFARCLENCGMEEKTILTLIGTPLYMAPQLLSHDKFSSKCDIWSLGIVLYQLLFGYPPWKEKSEYKQLKSIKKNPLSFPDDIPITDETKELLKSMLEVEEEKRIDWQDLFNNQVIKLEYDDIQKQMKDIEDNTDIDPLEKNTRRNVLYNQNNKVMGIDKKQQINAYTKQEQDTQQDLDDNDGESIEKSGLIKKEPNLDFSDIQKEQQKEKLEKQDCLHVDSYFTFERNACIFYTETTNKLFGNYYDHLSKISKELFFRAVFVINRKQMIKFLQIKQYFDGVLLPEGEKYTQEQFDVYKGSSNYQDTSKVLDQDYDIVKQSFQQIKQKLEPIVSSSEDPVVQAFKNFLNEDFQEDDDFLKIFIETIDLFLKEFKVILDDQSVEKTNDVLRTIYFTFLCKNLDQEFKWSGKDDDDIYKFYDKFEKMSQELLNEQVQKCYEK